MITPSFSLTATERVLPKLALDFTTATLDPRVTFTRSGNTATYINSSGVITAINADLPRFDYNPTTLICQGLLIEESRTNLLLNSLIDGTSLSTQSVTVAATAYTLSFYGTGSIDLSGTHTATVIGTGTYPSRKTYTFTPTTGSLTLTVTGTIQYAQLEAGAFATSFIPTAGTSVTRNADVATMTGTNFSSWYSQTEGSLVSQWLIPTGRANIIRRLWNISDGSDTNRLTLNTDTGRQVSLFSSNGSTSLTNTTAYIADAVFKTSVAIKTNNQGVSTRGAVAATNAAYLNPTQTMTELRIGSLQNNVQQPCGYIQKLSYFPQRLLDAELQSFSK